MKYLSDDGKVFMYEEECMAHERELKEIERKKAESEEKKKAKEKLDKDYKSVIDSMSKWLEASIAYENKYGKEESKNTKEIDSFLDFLMDYFD